MGYYNELSIDTRTCGQAAYDAYLDRRDGILTRKPARSFRSELIEQGDGWKIERMNGEYLAFRACPVLTWAFQGARATIEEARLLAAAPPARGNT